MNQITWKDYETQLAKIVRDPLPLWKEAPQALEISTDTRTSLKDKWFLPLVGKNFDGHDFIVEALNNGQAKGCFCQEDRLARFSKTIQKQLIVVTDTLLCLQQIARLNREKHPKAIIFAITGSVGKTTTKEMLCSVLQQAKKPFISTQKNYNNEIGVPLTLLKLTGQHHYVLLEMGARHPGDIETLVNVALPTFTACLNVGSSHLSIFKTKDNIYATKLEILKNTKHLKAAIVLGDDSKLLSLAQEKKVTLYSFGTTNQNDAKVLQTETTAEKKMRISCKVFDTPLNIELPATHESYPINALAASFLAYLGKIKDKTICEGLNNFKPSSSRFKTHFYKNKIIVDDSYNASPESLISGIKTINKLYPQKKISYILGDMLELGDQSTKLHRDIGRLCMTGKKTHNLLTVGTESKEIKSSAISSGLNHKQTEHYSSVQKLIEANVPLSFFGDVIYIKGSNSIKLLEFLNYLINK